MASIEDFSGETYNTVLNDIDPDFFRSAVLTFAIDLGLNGTKTLRKRLSLIHIF